MGCSSSSTRSCSSRSDPRRRGGLPGALAALIATLLLAGCGGGGEGGAPARIADAPEPSPIVRIAIAGPIRTVDPIFVANRSERLVSRQIFEPLVGRIDPPFGVAGARRGPARPVRSERGGRLWRFELRPGVAFGDGAPLNADAVLANFNRWVRTGVAATVLPELSAVDSPRPGEVRFQLSRPVPNLPQRLGDSRLGLVAPDQIADSGDQPISFDASGTGAYQLQERQGSRVLLVRSTDWWGERAGLGPGINQLDFQLVPSDSGRYARLREAQVSIADDLAPGAVRRLERQPLLTAVSDGTVTIGTSVAVRGLDSTSPEQPLSQLWLTELR